MATIGAKLHHLELRSAVPATLANFYGETLDMEVAALDDGRFVCRTPERCIIIAPGQPQTLGFAAYAFGSESSFDVFRRRIERLGMPMSASRSPLFGDFAFGLKDPDGTSLMFGVIDTAADRMAQWHSESMSGRLQHIVMGSKRCEEIVRFYAVDLGFVPSDFVYRPDGSLTTCFLRSNDEHHSFAVFQTPEYRFDHHCYETVGWNSLRNWGDRFAERRIPVKWGPGRHGPGNNLFIFIHDPDGNWVELSAEMQILPDNWAARRWNHEVRTLNLWGQAPLRA